MVGEAWERVKAESIVKVWNKTLLNRVNEIEPTCGESDESTSESEEDTASTMSHELRRAGFDVSEADTQAWLAIDRYEPGHPLLTDEEIIEAVRTHEHDTDDEEAEEDTVDKSTIPSDGEAYTCFSKCIMWLEAQTEFDSVSVQLLHSLQERAALKTRMEQ